MRRVDSEVGVAHFSPCALRRCRSSTPPHPVALSNVASEVPAGSGRSLLNACTRRSIITRIDNGDLLLSPPRLAQPLSCVVMISDADHLTTPSASHHEDDAARRVVGGGRPPGVSTSARMPRRCDATLCPRATTSLRNPVASITAASSPSTPTRRLPPRNRTISLPQHKRLNRESASSLWLLSHLGVSNVVRTCIHIAIGLSSD